MSRPLTNNIAIITGASQGLGFEIAKHYVLAGADLMLCARNTFELQKAYDALLPLAEKNQRICYKSVDVSSVSDVNELLDETLTQLGGCHILVNNAGIYGPKGSIEEVDWLEWIKTIEINVFGSVLLCRALIPHFKSQNYGKIIQLSGGGATNPLPFLSAYAVSKAAIVRFIETLAEEVQDFHIDVNAIAPGALNTRLLDEILEAGPDKVGSSFYEKALKQKETGGASLSHGADLAVFLGSTISQGITGKLISALWDEWQNWPQYKETLANSDAYTLRRITGRDRGLLWGDK